MKTLYIYFIFIILLWILIVLFLFLSQAFSHVFFTLSSFLFSKLLLLEKSWWISAIYFFNFVSSLSYLLFLDFFLSDKEEEEEN